VKVLLDTNVILDVLLNHQPHVEGAKPLFSSIENGFLAGYLCATTVTTISYLMAKVVGRAQAQREIQKLLKLFEIAPVTKTVLDSALVAGFSDFEDAVLYEAARQIEIDAIITRDTKDFKKSMIPVYSPLEIAYALNPRGES